MPDTMGRPVTPSAAAHAARIAARGEESAARPAGKSTAEMIADRVLPGYRADQALRDAARMRELRARGVISAEPEAEEEADVDDDVPLSTAEQYAAVELQRRAAEREANVKAQTGAVRVAVQPVGHRYAAQLAQPHRYAHLWQKP